MKTKTIICVTFFALLIITGCSKNDEKMGTLQLKTFHPLSSLNKSTATKKSITTNPPLVGNVTKTINTNLKVCVGDVWVSQGEVKAGNRDNLEWIKLTNVTNEYLKLFEDYSFAPIELPEGNYQSIKMSFKNIWYRITYLESDPSVVYELLETMGSTFAPCDENDDSWAKSAYFSTDGNHKLNGDVFELVNPGERVAGFSIQAGKIAVLNWRLGAGVTATCFNYLYDLNGNGIWDCGIDDLTIECPEEVKCMWDFVVEYE